VSDFTLAQLRGGRRTNQSADWLAGAGLHDQTSQSGYEMWFAGSIAVAPADLHLHHPGMARTFTANSTVVLLGPVDRVTFHNPENRLCALRVKARASLT
jgi:hypothetical protein